MLGGGDREGVHGCLEETGPDHHKPDRVGERHLEINIEFFIISNGIIKF